MRYWEYRLKLFWASKDGQAQLARATNPKSAVNGHYSIRRRRTCPGPFSEYDAYFHIVSTEKKTIRMGICSLYY